MNTVRFLDVEMAEWLGLQDDPYAPIGMISVEATGAELTRGGTTAAWAQLRNRTPGELGIEYRASFYGPEESLVEGPTAWVREWLAVNGTKRVQIASLRPADQVRYYTLDVRRMR